MCTMQPAARKTRTYPLVLATLAAVLWAAPAKAQQQEINWPVTFGGQPDFDFNRKEVVGEIQQQIDQDGYGQSVGTIEELLQTKAIDPFNPKNKYSVKTIEEDVEITGLPEYTLNNPDLAGLVSPSVVTASSAVDLEEFKLFLEGIVVLRLINFVITPPAVSNPILNGHTSSNNKS